MAATSSPGSGVGDRTDGDNPSISNLLKRLGNEAGELVRAEVALAKLEFRELVRQAAVDGVKLGAAAALLLLGAIALTGAAVLGLGHLLGGRYGIAALIVAVVLLAVGGLVARSGMKGMARNRPAEALNSLQQDGKWAAGELRDLQQHVRMGNPQQERPALTTTGERK